MKVNIVTTNEGWVLRNLAENYAKYIPDSTISFFEPDLNADINFYINYFLFNKKTKIDVGYFTHREKNNLEMSNKFDDIAEQVDWCISMCQKTADLLPKDKTTVVLPSPDPQFLIKKKIVIGVVGRGYSSGRKRFELLNELQEINGVEFKVTNGSYDWKDMPNFYSAIDYLLILSDNEGGPLPLYEALAMGVPVISSDVGSVNEFTTIRYNDIDELKDIIRKLIIPQDTWRIGSDKIPEVLRNLYLKTNQK